VLCKETHERVIRLAPPLIISKADLEWGLEQVAQFWKMDRMRATKRWLNWPGQL